MSGITPCLWFDGNAEEAAKFYVSLFPDSRVDVIRRARVTTRRVKRAMCCWSSSR